MNPLDWIPLSERPLIIFLLHLGVLSFAYWWTVMVVGRIPKNIGAMLTVTVCHYLITAITILLAQRAIAVEPTRGMFYVIFAALFLWMTLAPELYEAYGSAANKQQPRNKWIFLLRLALILFWVITFFASIYSDANVVAPFVAILVDLLQRSLELPLLIGVMLGLLGVYSLFRSLFMALFATLGLVGVLKELFFSDTLVPWDGKNS
jgi:hypothetical protein